ncbi:hypothetical protein GCM10020218_081730 [Dactylosporangium vinaceum]
MYAAYAIPFTVFCPALVLPTRCRQSVAEAAFMDGAALARGRLLPRDAADGPPGLVAVGIFNFLGLWTSTCYRVFSPRPGTGYVLAQDWPPVGSAGYRSDSGASASPAHDCHAACLIAYVAFHGTGIAPCAR